MNRKKTQNVLRVFNLLPELLPPDISELSGCGLILLGAPAENGYNLGFFARLFGRGGVIPARARAKGVSGRKSGLLCVMLYISIYVRVLRYMLRV